MLKGKYIRGWDKEDQNILGVVRESISKKRKMKHPEGK